ncbi:MAG: tetratricopeptide repeat protein [Bacteroidales bacterium]|jgi:tetratricopeptide (TPR) repeat protein|nr:tetratricopeptide repeat protein [Bacteroidales bacterium]
MAGKSKKPLSFWQELKRRKVIRVIIAYAAAAYVILELTSIIADPLGLPAWTINFVLVLLGIGFVITAVVSWIYDFTSEGIMKTESPGAEQENYPGDTAPAVAKKRKLKVSDTVIAILVVMVIILAYPRIFKRDKFQGIRQDDGRISIAVMPFVNQTGDTTLNWFSNGISSLMINVLGSSPELAVCDDHTMYEVTESANQVYTAGISPAKAQGIAKLARAETYITGSYQGSQETYWILANLVNTETGNVISSLRVEGNLQSSGYLEMASSLCEEIKHHLEIRAIEENAGADIIRAYTRSPGAYRHYIDGLNMILEGNYDPAIEEMKMALEIDSTFTLASFFIAYSSNFKTPQDQDATIEWTRIAYQQKENLPTKYQYWVDLWHACFVEEDPDKIRSKLEMLEASGIESTLLWYDIGVTYFDFLRNYEKTIYAFENIMHISKERGVYPEILKFYTFFGNALHNAGYHDREKEILEKGLEMLQDDISKREIYFLLSICALSGNNTTDADKYLQEYLNAKHRLGESDDNIQFYLGHLYLRAGMIEEAEDHIRKATELNPNQPVMKSELARLLIDQEIDINEGLEIIDNELLVKYPGAGTARWIKALACYKLGRYEEAYQLIKEANEILDYNYDLYQLQKEVEVALARQ